MADDDVKVKKERDPILMVCFVVFILAVCAISGASIYNNYIKADTTVAVVGSTVSVDYVGTFYGYHGEENAVVFDTSFWSVANDEDILKSNDFTLRAESNYTPLSFTVGGTTVLTGFGNAVVGYKVGDTVRVMIPAGEGYTAPSTPVTINASTVYTMPATEILTASQFKTIYGYDLKGFQQIEESVYGWPAAASYNSANNTITMSYQPQAGMSYTAEDGDFGKVALRVTSASGNTISFTYEVSGFTVVSSSGSGQEIQMIMVDFGTQKFYITEVTGSGIASSFTYKIVDERFNKALYFEIEIVSIN